MKVVAFNGSPRKDGNTFHPHPHVFAALEQEGIETELVQVGGNLIHGCTACYQCFKNKDGRCVAGERRSSTAASRRCGEADGIILASPDLLRRHHPRDEGPDRPGRVRGRANDDFLKRKVGAAVVAVRRARGDPRLRHASTTSS